MYLTQSEKRTIIIIVSVILIAAGIQIFTASSIAPPSIDYSESDSLFSRLSHIRPEISKNQLIPKRISNEGRSKIIQSDPVKKNENLLLNINRATKQEFTQLPRIGPAIAERIINYRVSHGLFKSISDLQKIKGIGPKTFKKIKPYLQNIE